MSDFKYITNENLVKFLDILKKDYQTFVPVKKDDQRFFKKYTGYTDDIVIGEVRPFEPLKAFFTRARELVAEDFSNEVPHSEEKPFAIIGVKACDLKGMKIQDHVFKDHDYSDSQYMRMREENLIISADCTCAIETCFCTALGVKPYPVEDFDINLSEVDGGFVSEAGSEKGRQIMDKHALMFQEANDKFLARRDSGRDKVLGEVEANVRENEVPGEETFAGIIEKNFESGIWDDEAKTCVECGACTIICPTCHCFLLYDQKNAEKMARLKVWDSCMFKDYARVAGGANPRSRLWMRLRNRFEKKFDFFPKVAEIYACTGCGRCISACPAKIDIRKVLGRLVSGDA